MAVKPISLPQRSLPNLQATAAGGRPFRVSRITPSRLFPRATDAEEARPDVEETPAVEPEHEFEYGPGHDVMGTPDLQRGYYGGMNKNDAMAFMEDRYYESEGEITPREAHREYIDKYKIGPNKLERLRREHSANLPAGDMDISEGVPEGVSDVSGIPGGTGLQKGGEAFGKGQLAKGFGHTVKGISGLISAPVTAPMMAINKALEPVKSFVVDQVKGLIGGEGTPDPSLGQSIGTPAPDALGPSDPGFGQSIGPPAPDALDPGSGQSIGQPVGLANIGVDGDMGFGGGDDGSSDLGEGFE